MRFMFISTPIILITVDKQNDEATKPPAAY